MKKAKPWKKGDKVAIVSLSSGMLGEEFCAHNIEIGIKRLKEFGLEPVFMKNALKGIEFLEKHPEARAADLKDAFRDDSIKGIICAIGGDDTYRLLPYLMEDAEFVELVQKNPKIFTGFSDTTINHLMFYKLGLTTYYGPCFICDLGEIASEMLPYTKKAFQGYLAGNEVKEIVSSEIWYEEREDFSREAMGTERISHKEERGFELLQGTGNFQGRLLGGCAESLYDILSQNRYEDEKEICEKYGIFPNKEEWKGKILFIETCEEKPTPEILKEELLALKQQGVFEMVNGVLVGKPQDEAYYEAYKQVYLEVVDNKELPILYNVNFGHASPRCVIPYGVEVRVDVDEKKIVFLESMFEESEIWELVDIDGKKTGVMIERGANTLIPQGMYHIAVDIWTKSKDGKILLTQRHPNIEWGLKWGCSGGSVIKGERSIDGARRELQEETGIKVSEEELLYLGKSIMKEYQCIIYTYLVQLTDDVKLNLQPEEVVDAKWVGSSELENMKEDMVKSVWDRYLQFKDKIYVTES